MADDDPSEIHLHWEPPSENLIHRGGVDIKWNGPSGFTAMFVGSVDIFVENSNMKNAPLPKKVNILVHSDVSVS